MSTRRSRRLMKVIHDERGSALPLVAVCIVALLGVSALAVDIGMIMTTRTEVQRVADLASLAGAGILVHQPTDANTARQTAISFAAQNNVYGAAATVQPGDVDVDLANKLVRVRMYRASGRGNPINTFFAQALGISTVDVGGTAAAQVHGAGAGNCLLPVALPDPWVNFGSAEYNPAEGDYYVPPDNGGYTGYTEADIGTQILLKSAQGATGGRGNPDFGAFEPGWWYLWIPAGGSGSSQVRDYVTGCPDETVLTHVDEWVEDKDGNMQSIEQDFLDLIAQDPLASWDPSCNCVTGGMGMASPRIRGVPMFAPTSFTMQGSYANFQVSGFAGVFIEAVTHGPPGQRGVLARLMGFSGTDPTVPGGSGSGLGRAIRLVE